MESSQFFQSFLAGSTVQISLRPFVFNLLLGAVLAYLLGLLYAKCGQSLSNRTVFSRNFVLVTTTTLLVISIVKSSLALSLGLVGALSIVRFRAAIKEPEELTYLYLAIGLGLGLGADQRTITLAAFALISALVWLKSRFQKPSDPHSLYFTVSSAGPQKMDLAVLVDTLRRHCSNVNLKRFDEVQDALEATFVVEFDGFAQLQKTKDELRRQCQSVQITFLDSTSPA